MQLGDGTAIAGPGNAVDERGEDVRVVRYEAYSLVLYVLQNLS